MKLRLPAALATTAVLALGAAACGEEESSTPTAGSSGSASSKSTPEPAAQIDQLTGRSTAVTLDSGFVEALTSLKVAPGPVGSAEITETGSAVFPITAGDVKYYKPGTVSPYVQGKILHEGSGLSLTAGSTKVVLRDFLVDPGKSVLTGNVLVNGKMAAEAAPLFFLDGSTLEPLSVKTSDMTGVLTGTTVKLKQEAADLLNKTFKIDALKAGLVIGVARIVVELPEPK